MDAFDFLIVGSALGVIAIIGGCLGWLLESLRQRHQVRNLQHFLEESLSRAMAEHWMQVPLFAQPVDTQGWPFCANLECGLPLENPLHCLEMAAPDGRVIVRVFCGQCHARLMEEKRAIFCG